MAGNTLRGKERVKLAMRHEPTDRIPVFCQLAIGHYMRHTSYAPQLIWYSPDVLSSAYVELAREYRFDGILVNLPGRPLDWQNHIISKTREAGQLRIDWDQGGCSIVPDGDNVHYFGVGHRSSLDEIDPNELFYIEPHNITEVKYPFYYDFGE
ncbi:MAG: hypothetical protein LLF89_00935, partial [Spirochaetaceae bacterium]|nr:hypothetical protein [Spirochaetaceae bacterium]